MVRLNMFGLDRSYRKILVESPAMRSNEAQLQEGSAAEFCDLIESSNQTPRGRELNSWIELV